MLSGMPYPISKHPLGLLYSQKGIDQIKSDLVTLLLTNPGERVMMSDFGTPLRSLIFEQNTADLAMYAKQAISAAITRWEPRITVTSLIVNNGNMFNGGTNGPEDESVLSIHIEFVSPGNIQDVQVLNLEVPLA